jgi:MFS family permease
MRRDLLGPTLAEAASHAGRALAELASVAAGLAAGARHIWQRRRATATLAATGANKFLFGILLLMSILLYRNYFYPASSDAALGHYTLLVVIPGAIGYAASAFVTPPVTRRISKQAWIAVALAAAGVLTGAFGEFYTQVMFLIIAFGVNVTSQSIAISAVTILQEELEDDYRGRVFAFYDMMSNIPSVAGAAVCALFLPETGKSYWMIGAVAIGYLLAALWYRMAARQPVVPAPPGDAPGSPAAGVSPELASPSDAAQPRSS